MPEYEDFVARADISNLIPEDVADEIIQGSIGQSAALSLFPRVTMSSNQQKLPVLSVLPVAYWVDGDTGLKQTTRMAWDKKTLTAEELAAIVPIPENVLDDAGFDIWGEVKPRLVEAIGRAVDAAVFFGDNKPASWPADIDTAARAAGNDVARGSTAAEGGVAEDINQVMAAVEDDGFDVNGFVTTRSYRARLRGARDSTGQKLLDVSLNEIEGQPVRYALAGQWPQGSDQTELFAGDFSQGILAVRRDITYKMLDQAVIQNDAGDIVYNLAQQDMVALRVTFRVAWQVANPITHEQPDTADRYPFAVLTSPAT